ncbi:uncharacterized protein LOC129614893, partial [Condylostylus longicornis]|uniref:uncharacterized protein LOC129614893 n=1 Tax=Condylostylus longicornis TaxID=2530218 RepID=UPI00244DF1CD
MKDHLDIALTQEPYIVKHQVNGLRDITCKNLFLLGDFNINILSQGREIDDYVLLLSSLGLESIISEITRPVSGSCIDHIFMRLCNNNKFLIFGEVLDLCITDHFMLSLKIEYSSVVRSNNYIYENSFQKNDSNKLRTALLFEFWSDVYIVDDTSVAYSIFYDILMKHIANCSNSVMIRNRDKRLKPWMTNGLINFIEKRNKLRPKVEKNPNTVKIKNSKDNYYFSKLNANRGNSKVEWQIMNSILNKDMVLDPDIVLEEESVILSNPSEVSNCFNSSEILDRNWVSSYIIPETYGRESFFFEPFTASEIHKLIVGLKSSNSKSSDLLAYIGNLPDLKTAVVIPLFKKGNTLDPGNYRPTSILFPISKFGFRKGKCTEDALMKFCTEICDGLNAGNTCAAIFIDIAKAFDTVQHSHLLHKLFNAGFRGFVLNWFESFISNRKQKVRVGNSYNGVSNVHMGVPQGSVLGPILFLVFINSLLIQRFKGHPTAFADDTLFSYSCSNRSSVFSDMNYDLDLIRRWFYTHGFVISSKTKYMLFGLTGNFRDIMVPTSIDNL